jgi:23S rRNA maturation-related 3'-5' exoribonuclease YhaM
MIIHNSIYNKFSEEEEPEKETPENPMKEMMGAMKKYILKKNLPL